MTQTFVKTAGEFEVVEAEKQIALDLVKEVLEANKIDTDQVDVEKVLKAMGYRLSRSRVAHIYEAAASLDYERKVVSIGVFYESESFISDIEANTRFNFLLAKSLYLILRYPEDSFGNLFFNGIFDELNNDLLLSNYFAVNLLLSDELLNKVDLSQLLTPDAKSPYYPLGAEFNKFMHLLRAPKDAILLKLYLLGRIKEDDVFSLMARTNYVEDKISVRKYDLDLYKNPDLKKPAEDEDVSFMYD